MSRDRTANVGYATGNCAHCHEQHASINGSEIDQKGYALFYDLARSQCIIICYWCHSNYVGAVQDVNNFPYSVNFGGATEHYGDIGEQFCNVGSEYTNCGSRHNLEEIWRSIRNQWDFGPNPDPCGGCHNVHMAQKNWPVDIVGGKTNIDIRFGTFQSG